MLKHALYTHLNMEKKRECGKREGKKISLTKKKKNIISTQLLNCEGE